MHSWYEDWGRVCRIRGCTDVHAFLEIPFGEPCHWVAEDVCSLGRMRVPGGTRTSAVAKVANLGGYVGYSIGLNKACKIPDFSLCDLGGSY